MLPKTVQTSNPLVQPIHTAIKGRARYKVSGLYCSCALKRQLELRLAERHGITYVSANTLTGNILVFFNSNNSITEVALFIKGIVLEHKKGNGNHGEIGNSPYLEKEGKREKGLLSSLFNVTTVHKEKTFSPHNGKLRGFVVHTEEQRGELWHFADVDTVLATLNISKIHGLSGESARERLKEYGYNILPESIPRSGFSIFINQLKSLPVLLLGASAVLSVFTGGIIEALVIAGVVLINATIGYITESHSERTIHSLKKLVRPSSVVIREGIRKEIPAEEVVPGDILVLSPGNYVAADGRLIETNLLSIDESALTGESMPVAKTQSAISIQKDIPLADRKNMVYMGTLVTGGQGLAVVVSTGRFTEMGKIQTLVGEAQSPETPMERQLRKLGSQLVLTAGIVCGAVFIIGLFRGYGMLHMLKTSISLAVAAVPEGLPTIATTTLALGIKNMRKHNVLIRHLNAVETLGCIQTFCLDKTGTITMNRMSVVAVCAGTRRLKVSDNRFLHGSESMNPFTCDELLRLIHISILCNETEIGNQAEKYILRGSPTENALVHLAIGSGVDVMKLRKEYPVLKINYRSENRNFMSTIHKIQAPETGACTSLLMAIKGSPIEVLSMCCWYIKDGIKLPLTHDEKLRIETENERMAGEALRVLGVAYMHMNDGKQCDFTVYNNLIWLGLLGMTDPIRKGVQNVIGTLHQAGINTVMITGDQSPTAYAIGKELNLSQDKPLEILDSTHITNIAPDILTALSERVNVFARVSPSHKLSIVRALQQAGKVVAMTGDGINDGPALKAADIGVAMGHTGTDVAREVADVVLEDDNLETMIIAISQGRTIYHNIRKSVHFLLSTNMSEIMVMFTAVAGGMGHPLNAIQLLWINLISDIFPGLALALEPPEPDILKHLPRNPEDSIVKASDFKRIAFESAVLSASSLGAYGYGMMRYGIGQRASTLAFMSLTSGQLLHAISCRSEKRSIFDTVRSTGGSSLQPNTYLTFALTGSFTMQILTMVVPGLRSLLGITPITLLDGLVIGGGSFLSLVINEKTKKLTFNTQSLESQSKPEHRN